MLDVYLLEIETLWYGSLGLHFVAAKLIHRRHTICTHPPVKFYFVSMYCDTRH